MNAVITPLKSRRKPVQQRARITREAILEAFVRLLVEKAYSRLTMRDIAMVAGVGLGTLYEHFPGKRSIAAHCIHERFTFVGLQMQEVLEQKRGLPTLDIICAMLDRILHLHTCKAREWSALILLEREISTPASYRALYSHILHIWEQALQTGSDAPLFASRSGEVVHAAVYGYLYQTLMLMPEKLDKPEFARQLKALILAYLQFPAE